jgi:drug/metabolite transporter (DMT)-like permease
LTRDKPPIHPYFLVGIGLIAISFSSILIKWTSAPPAIIGMYRLLFTCILLLPWLWKEKQDLFRLNIRDYLLLFLSGIFLGLHFWFWIASLDETSVASSMIITALEPFFVVIGAFFVFHERFSKNQLSSMALALFGSLIVAYGDIGHSQSHIIGDVSSLLGTIAVSIYMMFGQAVSRKISSTVYNVTVFFIASAELAIFTLFQHIRFVGYSPKDWGIFILLAIFPTLFGHGLFNWLLKYLRASTISMTILGEPIGAIILAWMLLGQNISLWQMVGGILCIGGVYFFLKVKPKEKINEISGLQQKNTSDKMVVDEKAR